MNLYLMNMIKIQSYQKGKFTLASGKQTDYYFNLKPSLFNANILQHITYSFSDLIQDESTDYIAGVGVGALPILIALSMETEKNVCYIRNQKKDHGTKDLIEGLLPPPFYEDEILFFDDVITTGKSVLYGIRLMREKGFNVKRVFVVVDRLEGGRENLEKENIKLISLFTKDDFK